MSACGGGGTTGLSDDSQGNLQGNPAGGNTGGTGTGTGAGDDDGDGIVDDNGGSDD